VGSALAAAREAHGLELLHEMEAGWPFFAGLLSNAEMACAKADPGSRDATSTCGTPRVRASGSGGRSAASSSARARAHARVRRGATAGPRAGPAGSIDRRNPYVDPLSYVQVALLRRLRAGGEDADGALGASAC
jgi:phosphoenolpyruvate carboxylase